QDRGEDRQHQHTAGLVDPLPNSESYCRDHHQPADDDETHDAAKPLAAGKPVAAWSDDVADVLRDLESDLRRVQDGGQPYIPRDDKPNCLVDAELGPLI